SSGTQCEFRSAAGKHVQFGNPWRLLGEWISRYELLEELDLPFPLGGCFGYWGYDLKNFTEPKLTRRTLHDLGIPDCQVGFYSSLLVIDHRLDKSWIVATGLGLDGSRSATEARRELAWWQAQLCEGSRAGDGASLRHQPPDGLSLCSNLSNMAFCQLV